MSVFDKVVAAVTPPESELDQQDVRISARAASLPGDWLSKILDHHERIETAFVAVKSGVNAIARVAARQRLARVLTGHANAEESVVYPALAHADGHASRAYCEQAAVKIQLAWLEGMAPMTPEFLEKLEHIRKEVAHHMYEEEGTWLLELKRKSSPSEQAAIAQRYAEEFERYMGDCGGEQ